MPVQTGQKHQIAIGRNPADNKGIPAPANSIWFKRMVASFAQRPEREKDESSIGSNFRDQDSEILNVFGEPSFGGKVRDKSIGLPILGYCNSAPVTTDDNVVTSVKHHVFVPSNDEVGNSIAMIVYNVNHQNNYQAHTNLKLSEFMIEVDRAKAWVEFSASGMSNPAEDATAEHTARAYPTENLFRFHDAQLRIADNTAGFAQASSIVNFRKLSVKFTRDIEKDDTVTGVEPDQIYSTQYGYMLDIEQPMRSDSFLELFSNNNFKVARLALSNPKINIGTAGNPISPSLVIDFAKMNLPAYDHSTDIGNTVMTESFSLEGLDTTNPVQFELVNTQVNY